MARWNVTGMVNVYGVFNGGGGIFSGIGGSAVTAVVEGFNRAVAPDFSCGFPIKHYQGSNRAGR